MLRRDADYILIFAASMAIRLPMLLRMPIGVSVNDITE